MLDHNTPPSGLRIRLDIVLGLVVLFLVIGAINQGSLKITYSPYTTATPSPTATTTPVEIFNLVGNNVVATIPPVIPLALPPSHEGGAEQLVPVNPDELLKGFPDAGVQAEIPPEAILKLARFSWYWPNLGGTNCSSFSSTIPEIADNFPYAERSRGWCWSRMSSGEHWEWYVGRAVACPQDWPFYTKVYAFGREWLCLDHGGAIETIGGRSWIDFLTPQPPLTYRTEFDIWVVFP